MGHTVFFMLWCPPACRDTASPGRRLCTALHQREGPVGGARSCPPPLHN